jgi:hypothetical protein
VFVSNHDELHYCAICVSCTDFNQNKESCMINVVTCVSSAVFVFSCTKQLVNFNYTQYENKAKITSTMLILLLELTGENDVHVHLHYIITYN